MKIHIEKGYMPQLDTLRAMAVLLVIIAHWLPMENVLNRYFPNGICGVTLFFVLSGFLITGILLKSKEQIAEGASLKQSLKTFYIRRSLRIFPLYYLVISIAWIFNEANIRENFLWHFFYASNFYFWKEYQWQGHLSHLWSLSVEEQFYLFWPALVLFIPRKGLPLMFCIAIAAAILYRLGTRSPWGDFARFLTPGSLDSFALGALLAYGIRFQPNWFRLFYKYRDFLTLVAFMLFLVAPYFLIQLQPNFPVYSFWFYGFYFPLISVFFTFLIAKASEGFTNKLLAPVFNSRILIFLGKISYALYLLHNFVPILGGMEFPSFLQPFAFFITQFLRLLLLVVVCSLSWYLFEKPILRLKNLFEYHDKQKKTYDAKPSALVGSTNE